MDRDSTPTPGDVFYARSFALITLLLLGLLVFRVFTPFLSPLAWALFIAFLLQPLHAWIVRRLRGRANISSALLTFTIFLIVVGPLTGLAAAFGTQAGDLLEYLRGFASEHNDVSDFTDAPAIGPALDWAQRSFGVSLEQLQRWGENGARRVLQPLASFGGKVVLGTLGTVVSFLLMLFLSFFLIRDWKKIVAMLYATVPLPEKRKSKLFGHLASVTRAIVYGTGITALIQGVLIGIGFAILGLPSPVVFGVLSTLAALIPMAGTPVVWAPAVLVLAAQQRWGAAAVLLGWGLVVATIDNFLRPWLASGRAQVGALTVFIGVIGGVAAFGAVGIVIGPLVLSLALVLIQFAIEARAPEAAEHIETPAKKSRRSS